MPKFSIQKKTHSIFPTIGKEITETSELKIKAENSASELPSIKDNRVLSLSGGGVKGIVELVILVEIEKITGKSISELFPIITGTSVGGLIGALLTIPKEEGSREAKYSAEEALKIFTEAVPKIFPNIFLGSVKQVFTHKYSQDPLEKILEEHLQDNRLSETTSRLIIPVTDLNATNKEIKIFDSHDSYSLHIKVKDVLQATTAAPTFFNSIINKEVGNSATGTPYAYADGGLVANRPANEALKILKEGHTRTEQAEILDHTMVCSLNFNNDIDAHTPIPQFDEKLAGLIKVKLSANLGHDILKFGQNMIKSNGIIGWLTTGKLVDRLMQGNENLSTASVKLDLPGENEFFEISMPINKETAALDDASKKNIDALIAIGEKWVKENPELIQKIGNTLLANIAREQEFNATKNSSESNLDTEYENNQKEADQTISLKLQKIDNVEEEFNKESILITLREAAQEFHKQFLNLKVDKLLNGLNNCTYGELQKLVIEFCKLEKLSEKEATQFVKKLNLLESFNLSDLLNLISDFSNISQEAFTPFSSCSIEAAKEELSLEGIDDVPPEEVY
ncbi:patatin-like phospholipase family protein [Rickettsia endosymbiont of Halotydeus destructor]|uniref:patatin-like phospholipase family protein n=1 Tax=Rickettsia endosymbiont of Halotydeus destructor TaxID=2996754 RepID=UPI003BAEF090